MNQHRSCFCSEGFNIPAKLADIIDDFAVGLDLINYLALDYEHIGDILKKSRQPPDWSALGLNLTLWDPADRDIGKV